MEEQKTEVGVVITDFKKRLDAGLLKLISSPGGATSYLWFEPTWVPSVEDGKPIFIEGEPTMKNINRGSLDVLMTQLDTQQASIDATRKDITDILAEMTRLDSETL